MDVIVPPTTTEAVSPSVEVSTGERLIVSLHKLNIGHVTSGHKIQIQVGSEWEDHVPWPPTEPTVILYGPSEGSINIRVVKKATEQPIGVRVA